MLRALVSGVGSAAPALSECRTACEGRGGRQRVRLAAIHRGSSGDVSPQRKSPLPPPQAVSQSASVGAPVLNERDLIALERQLLERQWDDAQAQGTAPVSEDVFDELAAALADLKGVIPELEVASQVEAETFTELTENDKQRLMQLAQRNADRAAKELLKQQKRIIKSKSRSRITSRNRRLRRQLADDEEDEEDEEEGIDAAYLSSSTNKGDAANAFAGGKASRRRTLARTSSSSSSRLPASRSRTNSPTSPRNSGKTSTSSPSSSGSTSTSSRPLRDFQHSNLYDDVEAEAMEYMRSLSVTSILNAEQERRLATYHQYKIDLDVFCTALQKTLKKPPSMQQWAEAAGVSVSHLKSRLRIGGTAKELMLICNKRLVASLARRYVGNGVELEDLMAEGETGLIRAIEKFDISKGFKFSTYAHWWIRQAVTRCLSDQGRTIRLPVHLHEAMARIKRLEDELAGAYGRPPSAAELAEAIPGMTEAKLMAMYRTFKRPTSADSPMNDAENALNEGGGDWLEDESAIDPLESAYANILQEDMTTLLNTLEKREQMILKMRFGLADEEPKTLEEVGTIFKVTRERIRQIEQKALRNLRDPTKLSKVMSENFFT